MKNVPRWGEPGTKLFSPLENEFCPHQEERENCEEV